MLVIGLEARQDILGVLEAHAQILHRLAGAPLGCQVSNADSHLRDSDNSLGQGQACVGQPANGTCGFDWFVL